MRIILSKNILILAIKYLIIVLIPCSVATSQVDDRIIPDPNNGKSAKFSWKIKPRPGEEIADVHILLNNPFDGGDFYDVQMPLNWQWNLRIQELPPGSGITHYSFNFFAGAKGEILADGEYAEFSFNIKESKIMEVGVSQNRIILTRDGDDKAGDIVETLLGMTPGYKPEQLSAFVNMGLGFNFGLARLEADLRQPKLKPFYLAYFRFHPNQYVGLSAELGFSSLSATQHPNFSDFKTQIFPFELSALLYLPTIRLPCLGMVNPFFQVGGGGVYWVAKSGDTVIIDPESNERQKKLDSFLKTGGGIAWQATNRWQVDIGGTFRFSLTDGFDQLWQGNERDQILEVNIGATYYFHNWNVNRTNISRWHVVNFLVGAVANGVATYIILEKQ